MTKVWKAHSPNYEIVVIPAFKKSDLEEILCEFQREPMRSAWSGLANKMRELDKFGNGLGQVFLWVLTACFGLQLENAMQVLEGLARRELRGSTGVARGIAMPHTRTNCVKQVAVCIVRCEGLAFSFDTLDDEPVWLFCLHLVPDSRLEEGWRAQVSLGSKLTELENSIDGEQLAAAIADCFAICEPYSTIDL